MLVITMLVMGVASFLIGLVPERGRRSAAWPR